MCDDVTEAETADWLVRNPLRRREFAAIGASAALLAVVPGCHAAETPAPAASGGIAPQRPRRPVASRGVVIQTAAGKADAWFVYPQGKARHPAVIMWPDIAGSREAYRTMGARLAGEGYAVLVVNQYYRNGPAPVLKDFAEWRTPEGQARLKPMIAAITPDATIADAKAFVAWLDTQPEVDKARRIGSCGYCMGGPFTVRTAQANPARVGAACSFHGASLVSDAADSPVKVLGTTKAAYLFAIAANDDARQPEAKGALKAAADAAGRPAEVEVYPAQHGWCTIDAPVYDRAAAEKAWGRMLATYARYL